MVEGLAKVLATVAMEPGVKRLRAPVPMPLRPWKTAVLEVASVSCRAERRRPGRVGAKRAKIWQVLGAEPAAGGVRLPVQVVLVTR